MRYDVFLRSLKYGISSSALTLALSVAAQDVPSDVQQFTHTIAISAVSLPLDGKGFPSASAPALGWLPSKRVMPQRRRLWWSTLLLLASVAVPRRIVRR